MSFALIVIGLILGQPTMHSRPQTCVPDMAGGRVTSPHRGHLYASDFEIPMNEDRIYIAHESLWRSSLPCASWRSQS